MIMKKNKIKTKQENYIWILFNTISEFEVTLRPKQICIGMLNISVISLEKLGYVIVKEVYKIHKYINIISF